MRKSAYELGKEARKRNTNWDLNPFPEDSYSADQWHDGWVEIDLDLYQESGLTLDEWHRYTGKILK